VYSFKDAHPPATPPAATMSCQSSRNTLESLSCCPLQMPQKPN